jgi:enterochelin esterase-like enzyme
MRMAAGSAGAPAPVPGSGTQDLGQALGRDPGFAVFEEYNGGHDRACWRAGLPDGLAFATADWER